jgi:hypothetical protein
MDVSFHSWLVCIYYAVGQTIMYFLLSFVSGVLVVLFLDLVKDILC